MLATGIRTPVGIKVLGPNLDEIEKIGLEIEQRLKDDPRHQERLCRAGDHRLFPRHRREARGGGPLRPCGRGRPGSDRVRHRRHEPDHHHRRQGALPGERPLCAGAAGRHRAAEEGARAHSAMAGAAPQGAAGGMGAGRHSRSPARPQSCRVPLAQLADIKVVRGPTSIKSEEGLLDGLCLRRFLRDGTWAATSTRRRKGGLPQDTRRLPPGVERRIRIPGEDPRALEARHPPDASHHLHPHLLQYEVGDQDDHRAPRRAFLPGGLLLVPLPARLQHEHRRLGGHHRPGRSGCGDRGRHAPLPGACLREMEKGRQARHRWPI